MKRRRPRHDAVLRRNQILALLSMGLNQTEVARLLRISRMTVCRAVRHFRALVAERCEGSLA